MQGGEYIWLKTFNNDILLNTSVFYHILCNVSPKAIHYSDFTTNAWILGVFVLQTDKMYDLKWCIASYTQPEMDLVGKYTFVNS